MTKLSLHFSLGLLTSLLCDHKSFASTRELIGNNKSKPIEFSGDASFTIEIPNTHASAMQTWLQSPGSRFHLLGTPHARPYSNAENYTHGEIDVDTNQCVFTSTSSPSASSSCSLWDCPQPRIAFFGMDLIPIFVNRVEYPDEKTTVVSIVEAKTRIVSNPQGFANQVISQVMEKARFVGSSRITCHSSETRDENTLLRVDLKLSLQLDKPRYVPLPPGFNRIGSAIVRRSGEARTKQYAEDLKQAFFAALESNAI